MLSNTIVRLPNLGSGRLLKIWWYEPDSHSETEGDLSSMNLFHKVRSMACLIATFVVVLQLLKQSELINNRNKASKYLLFS